MPEIDASPEQIKVVAAILDRFVPGMEVWVFGSRVTGRSGKNSDLDLVVKSPSPIDLARLADLKEAFAESDLPFRVDVLDWSGIEPGFQALIARRHVALPRP